jgi:hypothetical protein
VLCVMCDDTKCGFEVVIEEIFLVSECDKSNRVRSHTALWIESDRDD